MLGISKNTYYNAKDPKERFVEKYQHIKKYVIEVIEKHPHYGIVRIKKELIVSYKISIGRDQLGKLLKLWGLDLKRKTKKKKQSMIQKILIALAGRANLLIRKKISKPLQAITTDISELKYKGGRAYLCVHKDVFGQLVYGHSVNLKMDTGMVLESYRLAKEKIQELAGKIPKKMLCHQDQGSQYTSYQYVEEVQKDMVLSYSNPGTPTHNPGQESFFGRFKDEWKSTIAEIETFEELKEFVSEKIKYYNEERLHTSIGLERPLEFTESFMKKEKSGSER